MSEYKPSKRWARLFLPAVNKLIKHYEQFDGDSTGRDFTYPFSCPLCDVDDKYLCSCLHCPWYVLEKRSGCMDSKTGRYFEYTIRQRLTRLRRWKREMKEMLAS